MLKDEDAAIAYPNRMGGTFGISYALLIVLLLLGGIAAGVSMLLGAAPRETGGMTTETDFFGRTKMVREYTEFSVGLTVGGILLIGISLILLFMILGNVYVLGPRQAVVIESTLTGKYLGTDFEEGVKVMRPFTSKTRFDMNKRMLTTDKVKVQDANGSPVEVSGVFTWQIIKGTESSGPASLKYDIDDYETAIFQLCERGMRRYVTSKTYDELKEETPTELMGRLQGDLRKMGIELLDFGFNNVSYAPEIASAMLQVQQAQAVIDAKRQLATGAVETAMEILDGFAESDVLTDDDRSALVRNVVVSVINSEPAKPVIPL